MKKNATVTNIEKQQEKMIQKALRTGGFLFPETPEDVAAFEKRFGNTDIILPEVLRELDFRNNKSVASFSKKLATKLENFAMAAREGSQLPEELLKKMKEDRDKVKREKKKK